MEQASTLRTLIVTTGTRGDIQPQVAFAKRFAEMGHIVALVTHHCFKQFVEHEAPAVEFLGLEGWR